VEHDQRALPINALLKFVGKNDGEGHFQIKEDKQQYHFTIVIDPLAD